MKHICAWCGIETAPPDGDRDHLTTHGMCDACKSEQMIELEKYRAKMRRMEIENRGRFE
ncbi:MAG: hypothetical protein AB1427_00735 [Thermodesulfobacteriota bacterium]